MSAYSVLLINPYELGRQSFQLAQLAAWLERDGARVTCLDLSFQPLDLTLAASSDLIGIHLGMHTATRIAVEVLSKLRQTGVGAHICAFGLYAPPNREMLHELGVHTCLGGEVERAIVTLAGNLRAGRPLPPAEDTVSLERLDFLQPQRANLPPLTNYAHLVMPDGATRVVGFAETTRGCKHVCRHCPVVPIYEGQFRVIPRDVVMADVRWQVDAGAQHISFGDPDFLNGPGHALAIVREMHEAFPHLTYDIVAKVEHIVRRRKLLPELARTGCLFVTSAVESFDEQVLIAFDKHHSATDVATAVTALRATDIEIAPTFVPFTPWTTFDSYLELLHAIVGLDLVASVSPIQLTIRLLLPRGSHLLSLPAMTPHLGAFDPAVLGYVWSNPDPAVDALQGELMRLVAECEADGQSRAETFEQVWCLAHTAAGRPVPAAPVASRRTAPPRMSEPWYCCAEPTQQQLATF